MDGNKDYVVGKMKNMQKRSTIDVRSSLTEAQKPYAAIIACSDSRVAPEIVFDRGLGEIFVIRDAGNMVDANELGSIEFAVKFLECSLIMVLGHENCGVINSALAPCDNVVGHIGALIDSIYPAVQKAKEKLGDKATHAEIVDAAVIENVKIVVKYILSSSKLVREYVDAGRVMIVGARYMLDSGMIVMIDL